MFPPDEWKKLCFYGLIKIYKYFFYLHYIIAIRPNDPEIHLWAGNLLFNIGAFEDAVKAYSHIINNKKTI